MSRVNIHSRSGNVALAVIGAMYALGAVVAFVAFARDVWNAAALMDRALGIGLIGAAVAGLWFLVTGLENLGVHFVGRRLRLH